MALVHPRGPRLIDKRIATFDEAVADVPDGATVHFGGFVSPWNHPSYLVAAVARQGASGLTAVATAMGRGPARSDEHSMWYPPERRPTDYFDIGLLAELGRIRKGITSFPVAARHSLVYPFEAQLARGEVEVEVTGQGSLAERIRAARAGIAAFYTPVGPGTAVAEGKELRDFDGVPHVLETALHADFALIRAQRADRHGNLWFRGARTFNETMAGAATVTVAEVDEIVELGTLGPEEIHVAGVYVQRIVERPRTAATSWEQPQ
ncbi:MAG: 3-oxoacid CoA-transferase subunit A [Chloroflexi bacterium]|nr:3-oxoacid CoA-transferase subunit A [Chloroflexota bacterium]MDA1147553.1 3-oxoacid CoA-transferase subunit A [Chloroflexota bacterium]